MTTELSSATIEHLNSLVRRIPELESAAEPLTRAAELICRAHRSGGKILVCGNGGSAADSEHIVGELMKGFVRPRRLSSPEVESLKNSGVEGWENLASGLQEGIPAISLTGHISLSTAITNDNDPYLAFAQQAYVLGRAGDILIGLSTSGNSRNVVRALAVGRAFGLSTIGFTGEVPSKMDDLCDVIIKAPTTETYRVQEYHLPLYHCLCLMVEEEFWGD